MDFLNVIVALHEDLKVDIAERDYPKLFTIRSAVEHLARALARPDASRKST